MAKKRRSIVLDTSAFIAGFDPSSISEETYTIPEVGDELINGSMSKIRFLTSIESGKLIVIKPSSKYIDLVKAVSDETGDSGYLSKTDISILALAAQLKENGHDPIIATDDYSMQNTAEKLGLKFASLANFGIRYQFHWILYCPTCGRRYPPNQKITICENCGEKLKREPKKRKLVRRGGKQEEKGESQET
jgi:UPF0271 protein